MHFTKRAVEPHAGTPSQPSRAQPRPMRLGHEALMFTSNSRSTVPLQFQSPNVPAEPSPGRAIEALNSWFGRTVAFLSLQSNGRHSTNAPHHVEGMVRPDRGDTRRDRARPRAENDARVLVAGPRSG